MVFLTLLACWASCSLAFTCSRCCKLSLGTHDGDALCLFVLRGCYHHPNTLVVQQDGMQDLPAGIHHVTVPVRGDREDHFDAPLLGLPASRLLSLGLGKACPDGLSSSLHLTLGASQPDSCGWLVLRRHHENHCTLTTACGVPPS